MKRIVLVVAVAALLSACGASPRAVPTVEAAQRGTTRAGPPSAEPIAASTAPVRDVAPVELAPPPPTASTIRIATFNIENFGWVKVNDGRAEQLAAIVAHYDIVAVQEISDVRNRVPTRFLAAINAASDDEWAFVASDRTGRQPNDRSSAEQYAFFWNTTKLEAVGEPALFPDDEHDLFQREPYAARFRAVHGGLDFALVTVHTAPAAAVSEIGALADVVAWVRTEWNEPDVIALGDFNASCSYATPAQLDTLPVRGDEFAWIVPDDADTNVAVARCAYDRIVATSSAAQHFVGTWGVDDDAFDPSVADLSDHWPVWAVFRAGGS